MKRLAIFLDGTWNTLDNNTNVWSLRSLSAESVERRRHLCDRQNLDTGPAERAALESHRMHNHRQFPRNHDGGLFHAAPFGKT
jgi:hypothetical protein